MARDAAGLRAPGPRAPAATPYFTGDAYGPENAAAHHKALEFLRTATPAEFLASLVHAGIGDVHGRLLPPYVAEAVADAPPAGSTTTPARASR